MVLCVGVRLRDAERIKRHMIQSDLFREGFEYEKEDERVWFAAQEEFIVKGVDLVFAQRDLKAIDLQPSWRDAAKDILTPKEHELGRFGYDTVGSIAIVEIVDELVPKEKELAQLLLESDSRIKTVLKKMAGHEGEFRTQQMAFLAGENTRKTLVNENGCRFVVDVENVYFSIRLSTERKRISDLIEPGEKVLCMFSGAGPYPIVFAKNTCAKELVGIEINPEGHGLAQENVILNKVTNVHLYCGDVNEITPRLISEGETFNRITMPLPHTGEEFLPVAIAATKAGGTIHYYCFIDKDEIEEKQEQTIKLVKKHNKRVKNISWIMCGQHSPRRYRICFDILIE